MREADLVNQVLDIIKGLNFYEIKLGSKLKFKLHEYDLMTREHIGRSRTNEEIFYAYADYLMRLGDNKEKADFIRALNLPLVIHNRRIHYSPDEYQQQPAVGQII